MKVAVDQPNKPMDEMDYPEYAMWRDRGLKPSRLCHKTVALLLATGFLTILVFWLAGAKQFMPCRGQSVWLLVGACLFIFCVPLVLRIDKTLFPVWAIGFGWCVAGHVIVNTDQCDEPLQGFSEHILALATGLVFCPLLVAGMFVFMLRFRMN